MADWSKHDTEKLRALWAEGLSASKIGTVLDRTRNAVIGMSHRMGLPKRLSPIGKGSKNYTHPRGPKMSDDERRQRTSDRQRARRAKKAEDEGKKIIHLKPKAKAVKPIEQERVGKFTFAEVVDARTCMWPFGHKPDMTFCGEDRDSGDSYCAIHKQMAWRVAG